MRCNALHPPTKVLMNNHKFVDVSCVGDASSASLQTARTVHSVLVVCIGNGKSQCLRHSQYTRPLFMGELEILKFSTDCTGTLQRYHWTIRTVSIIAIMCPYLVPCSPSASLVYHSIVVLGTVVPPLDAARSVACGMHGN